jgi:RNA polymerase primary sigma factor
MGTNKKIDVQEMDVLQAYFSQIRSIPLLTFEEELELSKRIQRGDKDALKKLIEANLRLVIKIAGAYTASDDSFMDIIQEGNIGLMHAAEKYDHKKNVRFSTYANWWIKQSISRYFSNKQRVIRLPHRKEETLKKIKKVFQFLSQTLMREPRVDEVAKELKISVAEVELLLNMTHGFISLESDIDDEDAAATIDIYGDYTYNPEQEFMRAASKEDALHFLDSLKEKERRVIMYRYQFDSDDTSTLKKISDKMGISPETVRQIEMRALKNIRKQAEESENNFYLEAI